MAAAQSTIQWQESLPTSWLRELQSEFSQPYMRVLKQFLFEQQQQKIIYPAAEHWFNAFSSTAFDDVKVVILGQDPYHGPGQAHGLCFSVLPTVKFPPSLRNIFQEIESDLGLPMPSHGCLQYWAEQGVMLLNATLTVEQGLAGSHQGQGWEQFTDRVVQCLNEQREAVVFMLWGSHAQKKGRMIDTQKHLVLKAPHPSPLSSYRGFFGCKHFSQANDYLSAVGKSAIDWSLPDVGGQGRLTGF